MSVKTIYTCDKCGNEQFTKDQFWVVGVSAASLGERVGIGYVKDKLIHVCRPCLDSFGDMCSQTTLMTTIQDEDALTIAYMYGVRDGGKRIKELEERLIESRTRIDDLERWVAGIADDKQIPIWVKQSARSLLAQEGE